MDCAAAQQRSSVSARSVAATRISSGSNRYVLSFSSKTLFSIMGALRWLVGWGIRSITTPVWAPTIAGPQLKPRALRHLAPVVHGSRADTADACVPERWRVNLAHFNFAAVPATGAAPLVVADAHVAKVIVFAIPRQPKVQAVALGALVALHGRAVGCCFQGFNPLTQRVQFVGRRSYALPGGPLVE